MTRLMKQHIDRARQIVIGLFLIFVLAIIFYPQFFWLIPSRWRPFG